MRNAYYQAARFFVFKWLDDPVDFRTMRFLDRQIEETMDYLRIKNTFMPWGETKLAIGLNYLLYLQILPVGTEGGGFLSPPTGK